MDNFWIGVSNFIIRHFVSKEHSKKLDDIIKQGLYHADNGNGPYIIRRKNA